MSDRAILAVAYTPVSVAGGVRRSVGGFLRYIHYRDRDREQEREPQEAERRVDAEIRYVAHRDRAASRGRLFDRDGLIGDEERRALTDLVSRASHATKPQLTRDRDGRLRDRRRALYRMVLSPERARGLDLQRLARETVAQLERDLGEPLHWLGAEHRNTAHPHVHLVLAGFRETAPGRFRGVVINRERLQRMKDALAREIERQRQLERSREVEREREVEAQRERTANERERAAAEREPRDTSAPSSADARISDQQGERYPLDRLVPGQAIARRTPSPHRASRSRAAQSRRRGLPARQRQPWSLDRELDRIAESYRRQAERLARELSWEREERD